MYNNFSVRLINKNNVIYNIEINSDDLNEKEKLLLKYLMYSKLNDSYQKLIKALELFSS
jgi:hypothetical protein